MMTPEFKAECLAMAKNVELVHVLEFVYSSGRFDALAEAFRDVSKPHPVEVTYES